jgi:hypothetical protein
LPLGLYDRSQFVFSDRNGSLKKLTGAETIIPAPVTPIS